jgi:hypothetical protein
MGEIVYALCAITSLVAASLLVRARARQGTALLLWSALCFVGLAATNVLLFVDLVLVPSMDLSVLRAGVGAGAMLALVLGLVSSSTRSSP